jgi:AcrR family transcriptional regulator
MTKDKPSVTTPLPATSLPLNTGNHRSRVGADRRGQMRKRLIASAMLVFARRGADGSVIDEVISTAKVSRGSFYNHFRTNEELFVAVAEEVGNELLRAVNPVLMRHPPGAARVACGIRLTLMLAQSHPRMAAFLGRAGPAALGSHSLATDVVGRDIADAVAAGQFSEVPPRLAFDLISGPVLSAFNTLQAAPLPEGYAQQMAQAVLQSLGVAKATAHRLARLPLDQITAAPDSLLARVETLARTQAGAG